jgi:hypothetical protein
MPDMDVLKEDEDADVSNHLKLRDGSIVFNKHGTVTVSDNRRPIYAILTEPFRGQISSYGKEESEVYSHHSNSASYIPKSHVHFLEQSGIVVVPLHFMMSEAEILEELTKVNGVYICGDSEQAISNGDYQTAFSIVMDFVVKQNKEQHNYFPMFMMGKAQHSFLKRIGLSHSVFQEMHFLKHSNVKVELYKQANDTFLLHQLQNDLSSHDSFTLGEFFNRQEAGFRLRDIESDD